MAWDSGGIVCCLQSEQRVSGSCIEVHVTLSVLQHNGMTHLKYSSGLPPSV